MQRLSRKIQTALAACAVAALATAARADDSSPWMNDSYSAIRLIAGASKNAGSLLAGIEIKMKPGWHTYWRYPGDSGVPPRVTFAGSDNLANAKVQFPAPHAFTDETGTTIGYKDSVILPVRVVPRDKAKPVTLRAKIEYAVCEKLCVPAEAKLDLTIPPAGGGANAALDTAEAQVPQPVSATQAGLTVKRANDDKRKPLVYVDLPAQPGQKIDVFVEGPSPEWSLPIPKPVPGAPPGHAQFGFELDGLPPGVDPKGSFELTFTIVRGGQATEVKTHLD